MNDLPQNIEQIMSALQQEKEARQSLEQKLKTALTNEAAIKDTLEKYKDIDPEKYARLEEQELLRRGEYNELSARFKSQLEVANREAEEWKRKYHTHLLETEITEAFYQCGGIKNGAQFEGDVAAIDVIKSLLIDKLSLEDGQIIVNSELNEEGRPKNLTEKMMEIRKGSMGSLFEPGNSNAGTGNPTVNYGGKSVKVFSLEQARTGKASIDDIASGKAIIN